MKKGGTVIGSLTDNSYLTMLKKSADHSTFRHNLLVNNLSNVNTPGYKRRDTTDFGKALAEALDKDSFRAKVGDSRHIDFGRSELHALNPEMVIQEETRFRNDGSSVDLDLEMAEMSKNGMRYQMLTRRMKGYFSSYTELLSRE